jgi:hypothetical protein
VIVGVASKDPPGGLCSVGQSWKHRCSGLGGIYPIHMYCGFRPSQLSSIEFHRRSIASVTFRDEVLSFLTTSELV